MSTPSKEKLAAKLAGSIHDNLATVLYKAKERLRMFATLRVVPVITINPDDGPPSFSFSASQSEEDIAATLQRLLELPAPIAPERQRRYGSASARVHASAHRRPRHAAPN